MNLGINVDPHQCYHTISGTQLLCRRFNAAFRLVVSDMIQHVKGLDPSRTIQRNRACWHLRFTSRVSITTCSVVTTYSTLTPSWHCWTGYHLHNFASPPTLLIRPAYLTSIVITTIMTVVLPSYDLGYLTLGLHNRINSKLLNSRLFWIHVLTYQEYYTRWILIEWLFFLNKFYICRLNLYAL